MKVTTITIVLIIGSIIFVGNSKLWKHKDKTDNLSKLKEYESNNNIESGYGDELEKIENLNTFGYSADGFMEISDEGVKDIYLKYKEYGLVRSDQDGSLSFNGKRIREFICEEEGWRYFDTRGNVDLYFDKDNKVLKNTSSEEYENRTKILDEYSEFYMSLDMLEENPIEETPIKETPIKETPSKE